MNQIHQSFLKKNIEKNTQKKNTHHFLKVKMGHNSHNNGWILPSIELDLYFMVIYLCIKYESKKGKRNIQGVPQSQTAALPRHQEEEESDKSKQAQIEQTYEKH